MQAVQEYLTCDPAKSSTRCEGFAKKLGNPNRISQEMASIVEEAMSNAGPYENEKIQCFQLSVRSSDQTKVDAFEKMPKDIKKIRHPFRLFHQDWDDVSRFEKEYGSALRPQTTVKGTFNVWIPIFPEGQSTFKNHHLSFLNKDDVPQKYFRADKKTVIPMKLQAEITDYTSPFEVHYFDGMKPGDFLEFDPRNTHGAFRWEDSDGEDFTRESVEVRCVTEEK